jgi:hypothetical protein
MQAAVLPSGGRLRPVCSGERHVPSKSNQRTTAVITIQDVERLIPIVKPVFDGLRSVRDLWDFFRTLRRGASHRPEHSRGEAPQGSDAQDKTRK